MERSWYPSCFQMLTTSLGQSTSPIEAGSAVGLTVSLSPDNKPVIAGIASAASKLRLASEFSSASFSSYTDRTAKGYNSLFRITFCVIAFESYARMFGETKWHRFDQKLVPYFLPQTIEAVRSALYKQKDSLIKGLTDQQLQGRIGSFFDGEDCQIVAIAVAMRHAFAHGKIAATGQYAANRDELSKELLNSIKAHCDVIAASIY